MMPSVWRTSRMVSLAKAVVDPSVRCFSLPVVIVDFRDQVFICQSDEALQDGDRGGFVFPGKDAARVLGRGSGA